MKLSSIITSGAIVVGLKSDTLESAAEELLRSAEFRPGMERAELLGQLMQRERQASTAMERGVAIPHARISGLDDFHLLVGMPEKPLETTCYDGSQVELIFLILANDSKYTLMLHSMAAISEFAKDPDRLNSFKKAKDAESAWRMVDASGVRISKGLFAKDFVRTSPVTATEDMSLSDLMDAFFENKMHEAPVCAPDGRIVGAVTSKEIIGAAFPDYMSRMQNIGFLSEFAPFAEFFKQEALLKVREILNPNALVVDGETPIIQVVFKMKQEGHRIAYVSHEGKYIGVVDRNDIISKLLRV